MLCFAGWVTNNGHAGARSPEKQANAINGEALWGQVKVGQSPNQKRQDLAQTTQKAKQIAKRYIKLS
jgi:hypothetical protein